MFSWLGSFNQREEMIISNTFCSNAEAGKRYDSCLVNTIGSGSAFKFVFPFALTGIESSLV